MKAKVFILVAFVLLFAGCAELFPDKNNGDKGITPDAALSSPTNPKAIPKINSIELNWEPITNSSLKGYNIYRSLNKGKDYGKVNAYPITGESFLDEELISGITYYYVITSVSKSDKESAYSNEVNAIPIVLDSGKGDEKPYFELCKKKGTQLKIDQCLNEYALQFNDVSACREMKKLNADKCIKNIAVNLNSYNTCKEIRIKNISLRNECFYEIAISLQEPAGCNQIINDPEKSNACNSIVAAAENSIEACRNISVIRDKDLCFKSLALGLNDFVICSYISTSRTETGFERDICLNTVLETQKEEALCNFMLDEENKNNCYWAVGVEKVSPVICQKSTDENVTDHCIKDISIAEEDSDYCLQITGIDVFQECVIAVSEVNPYKGVCELIVDSAIKDNCYYSTAQETDKEVYCTYILENKMRDDCYSELAIDLNKSELCGKIRFLNSHLKNYCYSTIAINNLDSSLCHKVTGSKEYVTCFSDIAINLIDFTVCNSATKAFPKLDLRTADYCFYDYAEDKKDGLACKEIMDPIYRNDCDVNALAS